MKKCQNITEHSTLLTYQYDMGQKKTIKLVSKLLKNDKKKDLYSPEELLYMQKQIDLMKENRRKLKEQRKRDKGFGNE